MHLIARDDIQPFVGDDESIVRELASPENSELTRHSVAEIRHPPGTASLEHYHTEAEEVYYGICDTRSAHAAAQRMLFFVTVLLLASGFYHRWADGDSVTLLGRPYFCRMCFESV